MRKVPTYDWDWFTSHAPFKKILTEYCDLKIEKHTEKFAVCCGIWDISNHYEITVNLKKFKENFEEIKTKLLNTRVCKNDKDVVEFVNCLNPNDKFDLCCLIMDGCIKNCEGKFTWHWIE